jgi:hypothetical protein
MRPPWLLASALHPTTTGDNYVASAAVLVIIEPMDAPLISDVQHWATFWDQPTSVQRRMCVAEDQRRKALARPAA